MNTTLATHHYIKQRAYLRNCLAQGIINQSALARQIATAINADSLEAVQMAIRRYPLHDKSTPQESAGNLLQLAKLVLRTKIVVATVDKKNALSRALTLQQIIVKKNGDFRLIEGEETFSIISSEEYLDAIKDTFSSAIRNVSSKLTQVSLIFPEKIATTIGVCAYLYTLLAEHGINICEEMSCWKDVMIVIEDKDATKVIELLQGRIN